MQKNFRKIPVLFLAVGFGRSWLIIAGPFDGDSDLFRSSSEPEVEGERTLPQPICELGQREDVTLNHLFEVMPNRMPHETNIQKRTPHSPFQGFRRVTILMAGAEVVRRVVTFTCWLDSSLSLRGSVHGPGRFSSSLSHSCSLSDSDQVMAMAPRGFVEAHFRFGLAGREKARLS